MTQRLTYRVEQVTRSLVDVPVVVSEQELDTLTHAQLEEKAIQVIRDRTEPMLGSTTYRADLMRREEIK